MNHEQIVAAAPGAAPYAPAIIECCAKFSIADPHTQAMFLANCDHESGSFKLMLELWGPTPAQARYGSRADLGNTDPKAIAFAALAGIEVGRFYRGHGAIQNTGYSNHLAYSMFEYGDDRCARDPAMLALAPDCILSAGWFWSTHGCAALAAPGTLAAFTRVCSKINVGNPNAAADRINGFPDRLSKWEKWQVALGLEG